MMKRLLLILTLVPAALFPLGMTQSGYAVMARHMLPNLSTLREKDQVSSAYDQYKTALEILHEGSRHRPKSGGRTVPEETIIDLNLLFYDVSKPNFTILKKTARTQTLLGECQLGHMLISPLDDADKLKKRQQILQLLIENDEVRETLSNVVAEFSKHEQMLLALWNPHDELYGKNMKQTFYGGKIQGGKFRRGKGYLEARNRYEDLLIILGPILGNLGMNYVGKFIFDKSGEKSSQPAARPHSHSVSNTKAPNLKPQATQDVSQIRALENGSADQNENWWQRKKHQWKNMSTGERTFTGLKWGFTALGVFVSLFSGIQNAKNRGYLMRLARKRLVSLVALSSAARSLVKWREDYAKEAAMLPALDTLATFLDEHNKDLNFFLQSLTSSSFNVKNSYFSRLGPVLHAIPQFLLLKDRLTPAIHAIAELDALISIARLHKEHQTARLPYSFATYLGKEDGPQIHAHNFWHPALSPEKAVANTLSLGGPEHTRNMILTGPNAGGKSITSKGIVLNALLAQTYTIVPAERISLTPFSMLNTYLNIVDDIGGGTSQHRAEVKRAMALITAIMNLPKDKYALTVMDEMFRCTNPATGACAASGIGQVLGKLPNSILCMATHFGHLTQLAGKHDSSFTNYKVGAIQNNDGSYTYTYRLEPGINQKVIALDLLAHEGFDQDILDYAYEHLDKVQKAENQEKMRESELSNFITELRHRIEHDFKPTTQNGG